MMMQHCDRMVIERDPNNWNYHVIKLDNKVLGIAGEPEYRFNIYGSGTITIPFYSLPSTPPKRRMVAKVPTLRRPA